LAEHEREYVCVFADDMSSLLCLSRR
jgi:hypothetical protein